MNLFGSIWIEHSPNSQKYCVFCHPDECEFESSYCFNMGSFDSPADADKYLNEIWEFLGKNETQ